MNNCLISLKKTGTKGLVTMPVTVNSFPSNMIEFNRHHRRKVVQNFCHFAFVFPTPFKTILQSCLKFLPHELFQKKNHGK